MKRCKNIKCWTDYPFVSLGDVAGELAPVRHLLVLGFDNNKYATVMCLATGQVESIKAGYLYRRATRYGGSPCISFRKLERMVRIAA